MADYRDFFPIFVRTEDDLRADFDARANAGMTPADPEWIDTRVGSPFYLNTQGSVVEFATAYDRMNEIAMACTPATAWGDQLDQWALALNAEREAAQAATGVQRFVGQPGTLIGTGTIVSVVQTDPDVEPPSFATTDSGTIPAGGFIDLPIRCTEEGAAGNVAANAITFLETGIYPPIESVTNPAPTDGGSDVETDEQLAERLLGALAGGSGANVAAYTKEILDWPQVGRVRIEPAWAGPGTVRATITDASGDPLPAQVAPLQAHLDPVAGQGQGWAPINHIVTVATPTSVGIYVTATPQFEPGYSLDGAGGTVALRGAIAAAIQRYVDGLKSGDDVIYNRVQAVFFSVTGLANVSNLKVGKTASPTGTSDVAIADTETAFSAGVVLS